MAQGKRAGARQNRGFQPVLLLLAVGVTGAGVAWGYLVYAAIDFGSSARSGDTQSWWFLGMAAVGAVACLFIGLILVARVSRVLGITKAPEPKPVPDPNLPPGGRRASR